MEQMQNGLWQYSQSLICILDEDLFKIEILMATGNHDEPAVDTNYVMFVSAIEMLHSNRVMDTMTANTTLAVWTAIVMLNDILIGCLLLGTGN